MRTLELPRHGLQIIPYDGGCTMMRNGGHLALYYENHDALRREIARHSVRDAEAYDRFARDMLRQCRFIKPLLMRTPPRPDIVPTTRPDGTGLSRSALPSHGRNPHVRNIALLDDELRRPAGRVFRE
ncbi:MAG: hypothetical protein WDN04_07690 [Rhodospirillales bacterium]